MFRKIIKTFAQRSRVKKEFNLEIFWSKVGNEISLYSPQRVREQEGKNTNKLSID